MTKTELRAQLLSRRRMLDKAKKRAQELEIQSRFLMTDEYRVCDTVLTYVSTDSEIDTYGIISASFANGKRVAVPVVNPDYSLTFYYINSVKELKQGKFNILEPTDKSTQVTDFSNSVCVVPALCADLAGNRVGYGKGCYDRFLLSYTGIKVCFVYGDNVLPQVEHTKTDVPVDIIVSDLFVKHT